MNLAPVVGMMRPLFLVMMIAAVVAAVHATYDRDVAHAEVDRDARAVAELRTICVLNEQFRARFGRFAISLAELERAGYLDRPQLTSHRVTYRPTPDGFEMDAIAVHPDVRASFRVDASGRISALPQ